MSEDTRTLLVDASVVITLAAVERLDLLVALDGDVVVPSVVAAEVVDEPAASQLEQAIDAGWCSVTEPPPDGRLDRAGAHLGRDPDGQPSGDTALLAPAMMADDAVAVTDDRPLRSASRTLSIPVSGSIGILVRAVERDVLGAEEAKETLVAMDQAGARLSGSLVRRANRLIDDAAGE